VRWAALALGLGVAGVAAAPRTGDDWVVQLRWQATPVLPEATAAGRNWATGTAPATDDWPALRLRAGGTAQWRQQRWQTEAQTTAAWTPHGPALLSTAASTPRVRSLTLQARPTRRTDTLDLAWSLAWPEPDAGGDTEAQGALTLTPGRWITLAEWAPPVPVAAPTPGQRWGSADAAPRAGWRLQVRAERP
jgi:hypothetical protein